MAEILCIDCDRAFLLGLETAGYHVHKGSFGYGSALRHLAHPPHECDVIVVNLTKPICYDNELWGKGNDNFRFEPVSLPTDERIVSRYLHGPQESYPRYRLVHEGQLSRRFSPSKFQQSDVLRAVQEGAVPLLLFLNSAWTRHTTPDSFPNLFGLEWRIEETIANRVTIKGELARIFPELGEGIPLCLPLMSKLARGPFRYGDRGELTGVETVVNAVGDRFGQTVRFGYGTIWIIPECKDNLAMTQLFTDRVDEVRAAGIPKTEPVLAQILRDRTPTGVGAIAGRTPAARSGSGDPGRDLFISHASEDKDAIARPLAEALLGSGLTVWFDEYELVLGDSLRERIDEGLQSSRFGVVILSPAFFSKDWTREELNGLFALGLGDERRILPVWHEIGLEEVRGHSPILASRLAAKTEDGLEPVVEAIAEAVARGSRAPTE